MHDIYLYYMSKCKDSQITHKKYVHRIREVAQWVKALIAQADDLSSMPRINMVKERSHSYKSSFDHHVCVTAQIHTQINKCLKHLKN